MKLQELSELYQRDLNKFISELNAYTDNKEIWIEKPYTVNSGGHLSLHAAGSINNLIGAKLGNTGYIDNREYDFKSDPVSKDEVIQKLETAIKTIDSTLKKLDSTKLDEDYPIEFGGQKMSVGKVLIMLYGHLNYHLGQLNYHRRIKQS